MAQSQFSKSIFAGMLVIALVTQVVPERASAALMCREAYLAEVETHNQAEFDQEALSIEQLLANQNGGEKARETYADIQKLREKINLLRRKNGSWQTKANIDKTLAISTLETFISMDMMDMVRTQFVSEMSNTEFAAWDYKMAVASIEALRKLTAKASPSEHDQIAQMIESQIERKNQAQESFLAAAEETMSLKFVLEKMKTAGVMIDPSTLFGNSSALIDTTGNEVKDGSDQAQTNPPLPAQEVMRRAAKVDGMVAEFMGQESFRQMVKSTQALDKNFQVKRMSLDELSQLRKALSPDWQSNSGTLKRLKKNFWDEKRLSIYLSVGGPQLIEFTQGILGKMTGNAKLKLIAAPIAKLLGLEYERALRRKYLPRILEILRLRDPDQQLNALLSSEPTDLETKELVVSYIRVTMARDSWRGIMTRLNELAGAQPQAKLELNKVDKKDQDDNNKKDIAVNDKNKDDSDDTDLNDDDSDKPVKKSTAPKGSYDAKLLQKLHSYEDEAIVRGPFPIVGAPRSLIRTATQVASFSTAMYVVPKLTYAGWEQANAEWTRLLVTYPQLDHLLQVLHLVSN